MPFIGSKALAKFLSSNLGQTSEQRRNIEKNVSFSNTVKLLFGSKIEIEGIGLDVGLVEAPKDLAHDKKLLMVQFWDTPTKIIPKEKPFENYFLILPEDGEEATVLTMTPGVKRAKIGAFLSRLPYSVGFFVDGDDLIDFLAEELKEKKLFSIPKIRRDEDVKVTLFTPGTNRETMILAKQGYERNNNFGNQQGSPKSINPKLLK
ncbi:5202_t:CDS:2, partial [Racocetra persica]